MVIYEYSKKQLIIPDGIQDYSLEELEQAYQSGYTNGLDDGYADGYADGLVDCAASGECDTCYTEGFEDGVASGVTYQKSLLSSTAITHNGEYVAENGFSGVTVNVPQTGQSINNQTVQAEYTVNGNYEVTYATGYTGLEKVNVKVSVPQTGHTDEEMSEMYQSGYTDGVESVDCTPLYESGYTAGYESGYTDGVNSVDCTPLYNSGYTGGYESGFTDGVNSVDCTPLYQSGLTEGYNSGYTAGYESGSTDGFDSGYQSGVTDGINEQKAKLTGETFNQNGTYTLADGWSAVTVDVSGYTQEDLDAAFASGWTGGYQSGWTDGYDSGYTDGLAAKYINVTDDVEFGLNGSTKQITIDSNTEWVATSNDSWITVVPTGGSGDGYIHITVNDGESARTGSVTIMSTDSAITKTITITQSSTDFRSIPLTFKIVSGGTINWECDDASFSKAIQYKINDGSWTTLTARTEGNSINVEAGDIVQFRGDNEQYSDSNYSSSFKDSTAAYNVYGNIMSLVNRTEFSGLTTLESANTFSHLFRETNVIDASDLILPATTLTEGCYVSMFYYCSALTAAPAVLPATTLAHSCYNTMFAWCDSLTSIPTILPATTLADFCYRGMFAKCSNITSAPELPATALTDSCYELMFQNCTSLTQAPELPAPTLARFCYSQMFIGCTSLNYIKCLATDISATNCTDDWVYNVQQNSGTFIKDASMNDWTSGVDGIPQYWTVQDVS